MVCQFCARTGVNDYVRCYLFTEAMKVVLRLYDKLLFKKTFFGADTFVGPD